MITDWPGGREREAGMTTPTTGRVMVEEGRRGG